MKKPFFDHLKELNTRFFVSISGLILFSIIVYINYSYFLDFLISPLKEAGYSVENIFAITIYESFQVKNSSKLFKKSLCLPSSHSLSKNQLMFIISTIKEYAKK